MDPRIEEILQLTRDTNRMVHKMRRGIWWGRLATIVWWLLIVAISGYTYYVYAQPYVQKLEQLYAQLGATNQQAQNVSQEISSFFGNWMQQNQGAKTSTSTATTTSVNKQK